MGFDIRDWAEPGTATVSGNTITSSTGASYNTKLGLYNSGAYGNSVSGANPATPVDWGDLNQDTPIPRGSGGSKTNYQEMFNTYYNDILDQLRGDGAFNGITYNPVDYTARTQQEIAAEVADYLRPQFDKAIASQKASERSNRAAVDIDAASRGMGSSTWVTDSKNRISDATAGTIADLNSNYNATLAQAVASQFLADRDKQLSNDQFNASNQLSADEFNAKLKQALDELAYARAGDQVDLWKASQKRSGGGTQYTINDYNELGALIDGMIGGSGGSEKQAHDALASVTKVAGFVNPRAVNEYIGVASGTVR